MADVAELRDVIWLDTLARATARHVPIRVTRKEAVRRSPDGTYSAHLVPLAAAGLLIVVGAGLAMYQFWHYAAVKGAFLEDWRRERVYEAIRGVKPDDVQQLIILNQRRMDQYHQMTLTQASVDWLRSARACPGISPPPSCARHESRS